jgi:branched-chain amino acid transport system permease protein
MSAAQWRRAMHSAQALSARQATAAQGAALHASAAPSDPRAAPPWRRPNTARWPWAHGLLAVLLLLYPLMATPFFVYQIGAQSLALGLIALSLTFLGGYGGMVSLSQMTVAGMTGYLLAILGHSSMASISLGWPWWLAAPLAMLAAVLLATLVGWLSIRTEGIHTIMITLAVGVAFFYLAQQNYALFNGFQGFSKIEAPTVGELDFREPVPFYYLCVVCAGLAYAAVVYLVRAPFGIALQGIRDNPRRMAALGFDVAAHRLMAHAMAGLLAALGGVLLLWYNHRISPGSVNTGAMLNILIIAVLGGMRHPIGAFLGALVFVLLQNFAIDLVDRQRFNLLIGAVFILIVFVSPDGLLGLGQAWRERRRRRRAGAPGPSGRAH